MWINQTGQNVEHGGLACAGCPDKRCRLTCLCSEREAIKNFGFTIKQIDIFKFDIGGAYRGSPCQGIVLKYVVEPLIREVVSRDVSVMRVD